VQDNAIKSLTKEVTVLKEEVARN